MERSRRNERLKAVTGLRKPSFLDKKANCADTEDSETTILTALINSQETGCEDITKDTVGTEIPEFEKRKRELMEKQQEEREKKLSEAITELSKITGVEEAKIREELGGDAMKEALVDDKKRANVVNEPTETVEEVETFTDAEGTVIGSEKAAAVKAKEVFNPEEKVPEMEVQEKNVEKAVDTEVKTTKNAKTPEKKTWILPAEMMPDEFEDKYHILREDGDPIEIGDPENPGGVLRAVMLAMKTAMLKAESFKSDSVAMEQMWKSLAADKNLAEVGEIHLVTQGHRQISDLSGLRLEKPVKIGQSLLAMAYDLIAREKAARTVEQVIVVTEDGTEHCYDAKDDSCDIQQLDALLRERFSEAYYMYGMYD